jgi:hypothetical protein
MKAQIEDELKGATYYDLTTKDGIIHTDPRTVETVINGLGTTFQELTSGGDSSATDPRLPVNGFPQEPQSYGLLVHLLNKIIGTANQYMPRSRLSEFRFHPLKGKVKDICGTYKGLKPDGVGIIGELPTEPKNSAKNPLKSPPKTLS